MPAKRAWQGHIIKDGVEIGFVEGTITIDRGLQVFHELGSYDIAARREAAREVTGTIDHGFVDKTAFMALATGSNLSTFQIKASTADGAIYLSGCSIESYDFSIPADGWITESIDFRAKGFA